MFDALDRRPVVAEFNGGHISSDGGVLLIQQVDRHYGLSERIAACFTDHRATARIDHTVQEMVAQRLYGLVQGYEDLNDHDDLRHDPLLSIAVGKLESRRGGATPR